MAECILEMRDIVKEFPGVRVLKNVNFSVEKGSIHALVGENGAGKSTLMNVLRVYIPMELTPGILYSMARYVNLKILKTVKKPVLQLSIKNWH